MVLVGYVWLAASIVASSCVSTPLQIYGQLLEPKLGSAQRSDIDRLFGTPAKCAAIDGGRVLCEYRTAYRRNRPVASVFVKHPSLSPDLSPYDAFDVLYLYYDELGFFVDWEVVVAH